MELDNKKKGMLILAVAGLVAAVGLIAYLILYNPSDKEEEEGPRNAVSVIPEAEMAQTPDSKRRAYEMGGDQSAVEDYWVSITGEGEEEEGSEGGSGRGGISKVDPNQMLDSYSKKVEEDRLERQAEEERRQKERDRQMEAYYAQQQKIMDRYLQQQEIQKPAAAPEVPEVKKEEEGTPVEERDKIDVEQVRISRSSGVSSVGDDFSDGTGISSWDDEGPVYDDTYPFKCMFTKQEKLRSGERVSVRILEDLVVDGQLIPANTHIMATCTIGSRIDLNVQSLEYRGRFLSLDFDAYDKDGVKGIYAPDLEDSQVLEQLKNIGVNSGMRAMRSRAGQYVQDILTAGQMVISGTGKDRYVYIPAGYQFYLVKSKKYRN